MNQFYYLEDELNLISDGFTREKDILSYINKMARTVLKELGGLSVERKIDLLKTGIELYNGKTDVQEYGCAKSKEGTRKWYQFWK